MNDSAAHILTFEEIEAANDLDDKPVFVPQWGGSVVIRKLSVDQALQVRKLSRQNTSASEDEIATDAAILLLAFGIAQPPMDETRARALLRKSVAAFNLLAKAIADHNGFGKAFASLQEDAFRGGADGSLELSPGARTGDDGQATAARNGLHRVPAMDGAV